MHLRDLRAGDGGEHLTRAHRIAGRGEDALDPPADERRRLLRLLLVDLDRARHAQQGDGRTRRHAFDLQPRRGECFGR